MTEETLKRIEKLCEANHIPIAPKTEEEVVGLLETVMSVETASASQLVSASQRVAYLEGVVQHLRSAIKEMAVLL